MNNNTPGAISQHPASIGAYINHGFKLCIIPPGSKGPVQSGWNLVENTVKHESHVPAGHGIGLCHAYSGTMALDVDNWDQAYLWLQERNIDLSQLFLEKDSVQIRSGREGHGKVLFRMPGGLILPSKRITIDGKTILEFRCATADFKTVQDVLPPSIHPDTQQPYQWAGYGTWANIPEIPDDLLQVWEELNKADQQRTIKTDTQFDASWEEISQALGHISAAMDYPDWVKVGMALHHAGMQTGQLDQAYALFDTWSQTAAEKYEPRKMPSIWNSFKDKENSITIGTLFGMAKEGGWKRPVPTVEEIFKDVQVAGQSPQDWLAMMEPPIPEPNFDLFPDLIRRRALEMGDSIGCNPVIPLFAGLASVCGAVDARTRLELMPGWQVPPILWVMTIADPAEKKSPGSKPMITPLRAMEKEDRKRYSQEMLQYEVLEQKHLEQKKSFLEYHQGMGQLENDVVPEVESLPPAPVPKRLVISDATSQKVVRQAAERPEGMLCFLDEMNSWITKITDKKSGEDRSTWVQAYEGDHYTMDRVGSGSIFCDNLAVSIYGNVQPKVINETFRNMSNDGMLQRFLPIAVKPTNKVGNPVPEAFTLASKWEELLRYLNGIPATTYSLSPEAMKVFREFQFWYEETKTDEQFLAKTSDGVYMTALGKIEGLAGRLALVFHLIEDPGNMKISGDLMTRVLDVIKFYVIPSYRHAWGNLAGMIDTALDHWIMQHILHLSDHKEQVTLRELKKSARRQVKGMPDWQKDTYIKEIMAELEDMHWVAMLEDTDYNHRDHVVWVINPQLQHTFKEQRLAVKRMRQKRNDHIVETARRAGRHIERRIVPGLEDEE